MGTQSERMTRSLQQGSGNLVLGTAGVGITWDGKLVEISPFDLDFRDTSTAPEEGV